MTRHILLLLAACVFAVAGAKAATVSGTVTNVNLGAPASGQKIYLMDSVTSVGQFVRDSAFTNSSGAYSFTVATSITSARFWIRTTACGAQWNSNHSMYSGSNLSINLSICTPMTVFGYVNYATIGVAAGVKVYFTDTTALGVTYRDSTTTDALGFYSFTVPASVSMYRVYAKACGVNWYSSFYMYTIGGRIINLTANCTGVVIWDTVKNMTTGAPVYGQKVYLLDSTAASYRLDSAITDVVGVARFVVPPTVASGTLRVYTYACGLQSQSFSFSGLSMIGPSLSVCSSSPVISGTVTNTTTSLAIPGLNVVVTDSSGSTLLYTDTARTDAAGFYSVTLPVWLAPTGTMIAASQSCGFRHTNRGTYSGSNMTLNLAVCATSTATISGVVYSYAGNLPMVGRKVYLVDSSLATGLIISRDSTLTNAAGAYSFSIPPSVSIANYRVASPSCGGLLNWQAAYYTGTSLVRSFTVCSTTGLTTLSGTVVDSTGAPVASAIVTLNGSVTTTTGSTGTYSLTIPAFWQLGNSYSLQIWNTCGTKSTAIINTGTNLTRLDTLLNTACFHIGGTVYKQGAGAVSAARVYLIGEFIDTSTVPPALILRALDSTFTNASGQYTFAATGFLWNVPQYIKAALQSSDPAYSSFLPTYHDTSLVWSAAKKISSATWTSRQNNLHVYLRGGTNPGGPGFIGGYVLLGANKSTAVGDPLPQRILLLTTAANKAVGYVYSDASGAFSFSNLPYGSYRLFGDAWGKTNPPLSITLSPTNTSVSDIIFEENSTSFKGHIGGLGLSGHQQGTLRVYPNPAGASLYVDGLTSLGGVKNLVVRNVSGATVISMASLDGNTVSIPAAGLPAGVYLLQLQSASGMQHIPFVKD